MTQDAVRIVLCTEKLHFVSQNWRKEISSVACDLIPIKIHFSDSPQRLISRINEIYVFSIKYHYSNILLKKQTSFITVCFAEITLAIVIVLEWFL